MWPPVMNLMVIYVGRNLGLGSRWYLIQFFANSVHEAESYSWVVNKPTLQPPDFWHHEQNEQINSSGGTNFAHKHFRYALSLNPVRMILSDDSA